LPASQPLSDAKGDALYNYDAASQKQIYSLKPWLKDPNYFKTVRVSAVALLKMVMHARSGGVYEVMGLMQGYVDGTALVVTDAFRLPVEGTETRVNAQDDANEYMVEYLRLCREEGRSENVVGWYHSHPGYGCWLSGIDVSTQFMQQQYNDPFVAVVVDPDRTISANKVEIGAFRTYPENYKPADGGASGISADGYQTVPLNKAEDFGAHSSRYYSLEVEHFKSTLDSRLLESLWNKYWVQTLSQNPLLTNRDYGNKQMLDLGNRVKEFTNLVQRSSRVTQGFSSSSSKVVDQAMEKVVQDTKQVAAKEMAGLMAGEVKAKIFNSGSAPAPKA
jgi:COP9 signalosome complex subunit 5